MNKVETSKAFCLIAVCILLAGCASALVPANTLALFALKSHGASLPQFASHKLLYATAGDAQLVIYSYPQLKERVDLSPANQTSSECSDRSGDVFVSTFDGLMEFQHGGVSPIATIEVGSQGCSVDPLSGDLAVVQLNGILIFRYTKVGWHLPAQRVPPFAPESCGYDSHGNLFVDGVSKNTYSLELAELPKGSHAFVPIKVNQQMKFAESVQWDGSDIAITDGSASPPTIYRYSVDASAATLVGTTQLGGVTGVGETWIYKNRVVGAITSGNLGVGVWKYPAGGAVVNSTSLESSGGVTISI